MDLKNITMSDLKAKFSGAADKKTLIKFGIGFGAIIIFLIIYYAILNQILLVFFYLQLQKTWPLNLTLLYF